MSGYKGYLSTRKFGGDRVPQRVQNIVIRNYCLDNDLQYAFGAVEVIMPRCYMILELLLDELPSIDGIVCYSLFQLPESQQQRRDIFDRILNNKKSIHFAVEGLSASRPIHVDRLLDIYSVKSVVEYMETSQDIRKMLV
tara:strand:- start:616 stop:1032 length:417 start_codon:yes stop_codon:yes gene_type:complete